MRLTTIQRIAALQLLEQRPVCLPGTRAILNDEHRRIWHDKVVREAARTGADADQVLMGKFCDIAGVAD